MGFLANLAGVLQGCSSGATVKQVGCSTDAAPLQHLLQEIAKMFDTQDFQATDAVSTNIVCSTIAPGAMGAIDATVDEPLQFPCTLKQVADKLGVSYPSLRNKWIQRIESIYEGSQPVRNSRKFVTAFGFSAIEQYVSQVVIGRMGFEEYAENERKMHNIIHAQAVENIKVADSDPEIDIVDEELSPLDQLLSSEIPLYPTTKHNAGQLVEAEPTELSTLADRRKKASEKHQKLMKHLELLKAATRAENENYRAELLQDIEEAKAELTALNLAAIELETEHRLTRETETEAAVRTRQVDLAKNELGQKVISLRDFSNRRSGVSS